MKMHKSLILIGLVLCFVATNCYGDVTEEKYPLEDDEGSSLVEQQNEANKWIPLPWNPAQSAFSKWKSKREQAQLDESRKRKEVNKKQRLQQRQQERAKRE